MVNWVATLFGTWTTWLLAFSAAGMRIEKVRGLDADVSGNHQHDWGRRIHNVRIRASPLLAASYHRDGRGDETLAPSQSLEVL